MSRRKVVPLPRTPFHAEVEKFSHDGRGIARINGKTTFIKGALPQESISFIYNRKKKDFDEGYLHEVIKPSPNRVTPRCPHYTLCGGCSLQHLDENQQIIQKQALLLDLLRRIGHCEPEQVLDPLTSEKWNYRTKARLSVRFVEKKQSTLIGFREKNNPRFITEIDECPILHKKVDAHLSSMRQLLDSLESPELITQIEVAAGDEEIALIFRNMSVLGDADLQKLKDFALLTGFIIFLQPGSTDTIHRFYPPANDDFLHYNLPDEAIRFAFHPSDFTQVNAELNRLMIKQAMDLMALSSDDKILDLFCGLGNFSLPMAKRVNWVTGIEGSKTMVERATMNAALNGIMNTRFACADLEQINQLKPLLQDSYNKLLLDPPRSGAEQIVSNIDLLAPQRIVYISCNPATLARDAGILVNRHGYRFTSAGVMDMFPHTAHVESIALFEKG